MQYRTKDRAFRTRAAACLLAATGTRSIRDAIPLCVAELRRKAVDRGLEGAISPPYDPVALAQMLGVDEVRRKSLTCDGRIVRNGDRLVIEIDEQSSRSRRARFTLAHEVGHLILWQSAGAVRAVHARTNGVPSEVERLCDMLAAEVLVPEDDLRRLLKGRTGRPPAARAVWQVAEKFKTSLRFAVTRLQEISGASFGAGLVNVTDEYWEWHFGIGDPERLLAVIDVETTGGREIEDGRYYDNGQGKTRKFTAARVGADRILVVVET